MYCTCIQLYNLEVIYGFCVNSSGIMASIYDLNLLYSKKLSWILRFCGFLESFLCEISGHSVYWRHKRTIHERFLCKNCIFRQFVNVFFLEGFALYGMTLNVLLSVKYLFVLACSMLQQNYWRFLCKFTHGLKICTEVYPAVWMLKVHFIHWHALCNKVQVK